MAINRLQTGVATRIFDTPVAVDSDWTNLGLIPMGVDPRLNGALSAFIEQVQVRLSDSSTLAGRTMDLAFTADDPGDLPVGPVAAEVDIVPGFTTPEEGAADARGDFLLVADTPALDDNGKCALYLWVKLSAGTGAVQQVSIGLRP